MKTTAGRYEEFGTPSWAAVLLALVLAIAVSGSLVHATAAAHVHRPVVQVSHPGAQ